MIKEKYLSIDRSMYDDYDSVTPGKKVYTDEDLIKNILGF